MGWQDLSRSTHLGSPRIFCWNFSVYVWHLKILTSKSSPPHMCFVSVESVNWKSRELWAPEQNTFLRLSQNDCQMWHREHPFKTSADFFFGGEGSKVVKFCRWIIIKNCRQEGGRGQRLWKICRLLKWMLPMPYLVVILAQAKKRILFWSS